MQANIVTIPGDGIGVDVVAEGVKVLRAVATHYGHTFTFENHLIGGCAIDATGDPLPASTLDACQRADAVLLGAVGGSRWDDPTAKVRPEQGLLGLRKGLVFTRTCARCRYFHSCATRLRCARSAWRALTLSSCAS